VVNQVDLRQGFEVEHIQNFIPLWEMVTKIDLTIGIKDRINGSKYSASSAYKMQFAGTIFSTIHDMVWKIWDPPICKFFVYWFCKILDNSPFDYKGMAEL
jgi:hypothetical protein